jgi:hypothetical protein
MTEEKPAKNVKTDPPRSNEESQQQSLVHGSFWAQETLPDTPKVSVFAPITLIPNPLIKKFGLRNR